MRYLSLAALAVASCMTDNDFFSGAVARPPMDLATVDEQPASPDLAALDLQVAPDLVVTVDLLRDVDLGSSPDLRAVDLRPVEDLLAVDLEPCQADTRSDPDNCGTCGHSCAAPNATTDCAGGHCRVLLCATGFGNCDGIASNGCEANLETDSSNCGICGSTCGPTAFPHAACVCDQGVLVAGPCDSGWNNCDGTGCETDLLTNLANCGACGNACPTSETCIDGSCISPVPDLGTSPDLASSLRCGGNTCTVANGTPKCVMGLCAIAVCNSGWQDCNGVYADGCETNINTSANNCGSCNNVCINHCVNGVCN